MDYGLANGIYSNKLEGNATGLYDRIRTGLHNGIYNENIIDNGIVKNGLILYLDAGKYYSYPQSGATWTDLSGNLNNGTLTGGAGFNNLNSGCITFDGVNDWVNCGNILNYTSGNFTFNYWANFNSLTTNSVGNGPTIIYKGGYSQNGYYDAITQDGSIVFLTNQSGIIQVSSTANGIITINKWFNICHVRNGSSVRIYVNGVDSTLTAGTHLNPTTTTNNFSIGVYNVAGFQIWSNARVSIFMNYNRALTPTEVSQNYLSTKSRFNL